MKKIKFSVFALAALLFMASCGEGTSGDENSDSMNMGDHMEAGIDSLQAALQGNPDQRFVKDAIESNTRELAWLKAGENMGSDAELKKHAKMMIADHEQLGVTMKDYAASKGLEIPTVDTTGEVNINENKGRDWDEKWADKMVNEHERDIRKFEDGERDVKDEELRRIISDALPTLRSHLDMVKPLKEKLDK